MAEKGIQELDKFASGIWQRRQDVASQMDEVAKYICPDRSGFQTSLDVGDEGRERIWDSTPEMCNDLLASTLHSLLTSPTTDWLMLQIEESEASKDSAEWLEHVQRQMLDICKSPGSGFGNEVYTFYADYGGLGWSVFYVEDDEGSPIRFRAIAPSECSFAENADGIVDTVVRKYSLYPAQVLEEFKTASDGVKALAGSQNLGQKVEITHITFPAGKLPDLDIKPNNPKMQYVSVYYETGTKHILRQSGYFENPYMVARWSKRAGEVFGRGCGHKALPACRVLNIVTPAQMLAAEKISNPPVAVTDDTVIGPVRSGPGGITYLRPNSEIKPFPTPVNIEATEVIIQRQQTMIREAFMYDRLVAANDPQMTATQVMAIERRRYMLLSSVLSRLESEFLAGLIDRLFGIMFRRDLLPPIPEELGGQELRVKYVSPISRAQMQTQAESFMGAMQYMQPIMAINPESADNIDPDAVVRDTQKVFGYPEIYLRPEKDVQAMREARAQQVQQQQQAAMAIEAAKSGILDQESGGMPSA